MRRPPAPPYWNPLIGIFRIFRPFPAEIRPARRGSSIHWHRFRYAGGGRAGVGGGGRRDLVRSIPPPLLSFSLFHFLSFSPRGGGGVAHRGWGGLWPCLLLLFTFSHGDGEEEEEARKIPTPPAFTADISLSHRRPSSPPSNAATAIIIPAATLHYHYRG